MPQEFKRVEYENCEVETSETELLKVSPQRPFILLTLSVAHPFSRNSFSDPIIPCGQPRYEFETAVILRARLLSIFELGSEAKGNNLALGEKRVAITP